MLDDNDEVFKMVQYSPPSAWLEWGAYLWIFIMFIATAMTNHVYLLALLTGCFMFWNYLYFNLMRAYIRYINASNFSDLLHKLDAIKNNKPEDGTFQDSSSLTKESSSEDDTGDQ